MVIEAIIRWTFDLSNTALEYSVQPSYKPPFPKPSSGALDALGLKSRIAYEDKLGKERNITPRTMRFIEWWKTFAPHSKNELIDLLSGSPVAMSTFNSFNRLIQTPSFQPPTSPKSAFRNISVPDTGPFEEVFG